MDSLINREDYKGFIEVIQKGIVDSGIVTRHA